MKSIINRLREPSTYAGVAAVVAGIGTVGKINEAEAIATIIASNGPSIGMMLAGFLAMVMGEKGGN